MNRWQFFISAGWWLALLAVIAGASLFYFWAIQDALRPVTEIVR